MSIRTSTKNKSNKKLATVGLGRVKVLASLFALVGLSTSGVLLLNNVEKVSAEPTHLDVTIRVLQDGTNDGDPDGDGIDNWSTSTVSGNGTTVTEDSGDDSPADYNTYEIDGYDRGPANGVVRTNDIVSYLVELNINQDISEDTLVTLDAIGGQYWATLPGTCQTLDVTPLSSLNDTDGDGYNDQMICNVGNLDEGTLLHFNADSVTMPTAGNGDLVSASVSADSTNAENSPTDISEETTVSAGPFYDLEKNFEDQTPNNGPGGVVGPDGSSLGNLVTYSISVKATKGSGVLDSGNISLRDRMCSDHGENNTAYSGDIFNPVSNCQGNNADLDEELYGYSGNIGCGLWGTNGTQPSSYVPYGGLSVGGATALNSVSDSGTVTCTQGANGNDVLIDITGIDTSLAIKPTETSKGQPLGLTDTHIASIFVKFWIARDAIALDDGDPAYSDEVVVDNRVLFTNNTYNQPTVGGTTVIEPEGAPPYDPNFSNNWARTALRAVSGGGDFNHEKRFQSALPRGNREVAPGDIVQFATTSADIGASPGDRNVMCSIVDTQVWEFHDIPNFDEQQRFTNNNVPHDPSALYNSNSDIYQNGSSPFIQYRPYGVASVQYLPFSMFGGGDSVFKFCNFRQQLRLQCIPSRSCRTQMSQC